MGIRQQINSRPLLGYVGSSVLVTFAVTLALCSRANSRPRIVLSDKAYFSADDGKTWFADSVTKPTPFRLQDGGEAVLAHVFSFNDRDLFIGYLERDDGGAGQAKATSNASASFAPGSLGSRVVKRPRDKAWVQMTSSQGIKIMNVRSADGAEATQMQPASDAK
jgi:hypothetical protein